MGIRVEDLSEAWGCDVVRYWSGDQAQLVFAGQQFSSLSGHAAMLCDHKHACKAVLSEAGLPVPKGIFFHDPAEIHLELELLLERSGKVVCKPVDGMHGDGVRVGLGSVAEVVEHWRSIAGNLGGYLVEEQIEGRDLRLQAVGGRLVAACVREPAQVVGDGISTVAQLAHRRDEACQVQNPLNRLILDAHSLELLSQVGLGPDSIPSAGRRVRLKALNNISLGGLPVDVTDELHPTYADWVARIAGALGMRIFSVDVLSTDHRAAPAGARIIEVNARPEWLHHTFSERATHDLPGLILADLFGL